MKIAEIGHKCVVEDIWECVESHDELVMAATGHMDLSVNFCPGCGAISQAHLATLDPVEQREIRIQALAALKPRTPPFHEDGVHGSGNERAMYGVVMYAVSVKDAVAGSVLYPDEETAEIWRSGDTSLPFVITPVRIARMAWRVK